MSVTALGDVTITLATGEYVAITVAGVTKLRIKNVDGTDAGFTFELVGPMQQAADLGAYTPVIEYWDS